MSPIDLDGDLDGDPHGDPHGDLDGDLAGSLPRLEGEPRRGVLQA